MSCLVFDAGHRAEHHGPRRPLERLRAACLAAASIALHLDQRTLLGHCIEHLARPTSGSRGGAHQPSETDCDTVTFGVKRENYR